MKGTMLILIPFMLLALQLHEFGYSVNGENTHTGRLGYLNVVERIKRLGELLEDKFIRDNDNVHKLHDAKKRLNPKKNTLDTNLRLLMAKFAGYDVNKVGEENARAAQRFVAYIYTIIMDAWISGGTHFKDFINVFSEMRKLKVILEKQAPKMAKYLKAAEPMPKGVSDWGPFYMNADQLDQIIKLHGHDQERREQPVGNDVEENAAYTKEENLNKPAWGEGHPGMLARVEEVVKLLLELLLHVNSDGKCTIFSHPDKFKEIATTELKPANIKVYEIFGLEQGYCPVVQKDICTEKDVANYKKKPAEKLLKLLARFYVAVWQSWLHKQTRFMHLDELSQKLAMVNEHYASKDGWKEDLQHAQTDLAERIKFYEKAKDANDEKIFPGIEESWGWVYATDEFYSKAQRKATLVEPKGKEKAGSSSSGRGGRFANLF